MSRDELIAHARELSINRPELMTRVELRDEIIRLSETDEEQRRRARGWLGVARDLVASVVEQRLNLPDAAEMIRGANLRVPKHVPPVATVTLAEIYAAQGHLPRAIKLLDEVLLREPYHAAAEALRSTLIEQQAASLAEADVEMRQSLIPEPEAWMNTSPPPDAAASWSAEVADSVTTPDDTGASAEPEIASPETMRAKFEAYSRVAGIAQVSATESKVEAADEVAQVPISAATVADPEAETADRVAAMPTRAAIAAELDIEVAHGVAQVPISAAVGAEPEVEVTAPVTMESIESAVVTDGMKSATVDASASVVAQAAVVSGIEPESAVSLPVAVPEILGEVLLYRRSETSVVCHWSLTADTWESRQVHRDGQWVVRVFQVKAAAGPLESEEADIELPGTSGEILLHDIEASHQVRMAIGWKSANGFTPVIIGIEVAGEVPEQLSIAWSPLPSVTDPPLDVWLDHARRSWHALSIGAAPL